MYWIAAEAEPIVPAWRQLLAGFWQELAVGAVGFAILCYVLMRYVFPRMDRTLTARVDAIEGGAERAEAARADANQLLKQYRAELAEARTAAARIRDDARNEAEGVRHDVLTKARQESERIIAAGEEHLAAERQTIARELRAEVDTLAVNLASKIVGRPLADEARR